VNQTAPIRGTLTAEDLDKEITKRAEQISEILLEKGLLVAVPDDQPPGNLPDSVVMNAMLTHLTMMYLGWRSHHILHDNGFELIGEDDPRFAARFGQMPTMRM
jgi:hypothetical protein